MADNPDDLSKWTFDDDFVRGGRHEPAARTRDAIARHSGERTSWRQPGAPVAERRVRTRGRRRISWSRSILVSLLLTGLVALGVWIANGHSSGSTIAAPAVPDAPTIAANTANPAVTPTGTTRPDDSIDAVYGVNEATPVGTCFATTAREEQANYRGPTNLREVDCSAAHTHELIAHENAAGGSAYPADSYWNGPVERTCEQALITYAGRRAHGVPRVAGRVASFVRPMRQGWAQGDRAVECFARSVVPHTASVRG